MSTPLKLLALLLAAALHLPLFVLLDSGLQRGQPDGSRNSGRVAMTLAARPAPQPPAKAAPAPTAASVPPTSTPAVATRPAPTEEAASPQLAPREPAVETERETSNTKQARVSDGADSQDSDDPLGLGGSADQGALDSERARYLGQLQAAIERLKHYPQQARLRRQQGTVAVRFSIAGDGSIRNLEIVKSSGSSILDRSVEQLFRRLQLPAPTGELLPTLQQLTLPVTFQLQTG